MATRERWRRLRKSNRTWDSSWLPALAALAGGTSAAFAVNAIGDALGAPGGGASATAVLAAFAFGALAIGLPCFLLKYACARVIRELRAVVNVRPLTGPRMISSDPWAMEAAFAEQLVALLDEGPDRVVECGSGESTLLIARRLEERNSGHVTALEHLEEFAERTRALLAGAGLSHRATVLHAPLVEQEVDGRRAPWYDPGSLGRLPGRIDLLVVDGPPCHTGPMARWPAVHLLADRLGPGGVVHMDDGDRPDERRTAHEWERRLNALLTYVPGGKGGWVLRLP